MEYLGFIWQTLRVIIILGFMPGVITWITALLQLPEMLNPKSFLFFIWARLVSAASIVLQLHIMCTAVITINESPVDSTLKIVTQIIIIMLFVFFSMFSSGTQDNEIIFSETIDSALNMGKVLLVIPMYLLVLNFESLMELQPTAFVMNIFEFLSEFPIWLLLIIDIAISNLFKFLLVFVLGIFCQEK